MSEIIFHVYDPKVWDKVCHYSDILRHFLDQFVIKIKQKVEQLTSLVFHYLVGFMDQITKKVYRFPPVVMYFVSNVHDYFSRLWSEGLRQSVSL